MGGAHTVAIPRTRTDQKTGEKKPTGAVREVHRAKRYVGRVTTLEGKRVSKYVYGQGATPVEARRNLEKNLAAFYALPEEERLMPRTARQLTLADYYWDTWLPASERRYKTSEGLSSNRNRIEAHILPALGVRPLRDLNRADIRAFIERTLPAKGFKENYIKSIVTSLSTVLNQAVEDGKMAANPMSSMKLGVKTTKRVIDIPPGFIDAFQRLVQGTQEEARWMLSLQIGVRPGETLGLMWDAVHGVVPGDDRKPMVIIRQQLRPKNATHGPGCRRTKDGKGWECAQQAPRCPKWGANPPETGVEIERSTKSSTNRYVPLNQTLVRLLREQYTRQQGWRAAHPHDWAAYEKARPDLAGLVFTTERGKYRRQQDDGEILRKLLARLAAETNGRISTTFTPHGCRHIAITMMALAGIPQHVLGAIVGHVDAETTAMYIQIQAEDTRGAIERIGERHIEEVRELERARIRAADEEASRARAEEKARVEAATTTWRQARSKGGAVVYDPRIHPAPPDGQWEPSWLPEELRDALSQPGVRPGAVGLFAGDLTLDEIQKYAAFGATDAALVRQVVLAEIPDLLAQELLRG